MSRQMTFESFMSEWYNYIQGCINFRDTRLVTYAIDVFQRALLIRFQKKIAPDVLQRVMNNIKNSTQVDISILMKKEIDFNLPEHGTNDYQFSMIYQKMITKLNDIFGGKLLQRDSYQMLQYNIFYEEFLYDITLYFSMTLVYTYYHNIPKEGIVKVIQYFDSKAK